MNLLDLTLPTPAENLACDEVLVDLCEDGRADGILRFWEPREYFVVVGYGNRVVVEVNTTACKAERVPILRRSRASRNPATSRKKTENQRRGEKMLRLLTASYDTMNWQQSM